MRLRTSGPLLLSKAISGFLQYKAAEGLSPNTISSYEHDLKLWLEFTTDQPVHWIKTQQLNEYFVWLRTTYVPRRITGNQQALSFTLVLPSDQAGCNITESRRPIGPGGRDHFRSE